MVKVNDISIDLEDRHVVLVEDIVDTGLTLQTLKDRVMEAGAASVAIVTLLNKTSRRTNGMQPEYAGFECEVGRRATAVIEMSRLTKSLIHANVLARCCADFAVTMRRETFCFFVLLRTRRIMTFETF